MSAIPRSCRCSSRTRRRFASADARRRRCTSSCAAPTCVLYSSDEAFACTSCRPGTDAEQRHVRPAQHQPDPDDTDRPQACARLGVSPSVIENALANAYNQQQVSTISRRDQRVLGGHGDRAERAARRLGAGQVHRAGLRTRRGHLTDVATFEHTAWPLSIAHSGQMASVTISFNLAGHLARRRDSSGEQDRRQGLAGDDHLRLRRHGTGVPAVLAGSRHPAADHRVHHLYLFSGSCAESFVHPITLLTGLPFAAFGALARRSTSRRWSSACTGTSGSSC